MKNLSETKDYDFNLRKFILDLQKEFEENKNILKKANAIDASISKKLIELEEIKSILNEYQKSNLSDKSISKKMVVYSGNPYLTVNILMEAIVSKTQVLLLSEEFMVGVNNIIFTIFKNVLKEYKINDIFETQVNYSIKEIKESSTNFDEIIVIGNTTTMQLLEDLENTKFYAYNNIILYSDDDKYEKLQNIIYKYAGENEYELEILYEENPEDVVQVINDDKFANIVILLSKDENTKKLFSNINNKNVFINKNPFVYKTGLNYSDFKI